MAHEKTWQFAQNVVHGDTSSVVNQGGWWLWWVVQLLVGRVPLTDASGAAIASPQGLWTIAGSSDGVTGAMDGVDRWGSVWTPSKLVWSGSNTAARSWIVLKAPGNFWMIFDLYTNGSAGFFMHRTDCWTAPTGGSVSAIPTATVSINQATGSSGGFQFFDNVSGAPRHVHGILCADGSFLVLDNKDASGVFDAVLSVTTLVETKTLDNYPQWVVYGDFNASGAFRRWGGGASNQVGNVWIAPTCASNDGVGCNGAFLIPFLVQSINAGQRLGQVLGGGQERCGGGYDDFPIYVTPTDGGRFSLKGRIQDIRYTHEYIGDGTVTPTSGPITDMVVGGVWIPANQAPSL